MLILSRIIVRAMLVVWAVVICYFATKKIRSKESGTYQLLFNSIVVANIGYLIMPMSKDVSTYHLAIVLTYWGGGFAVLAMLVLSMHICKIKESLRPLPTICFIFTVINIMSSFTILSNRFFFKEDFIVYDETINKMSGGVTLGFGAYMYLTMLAIYMVLTVGVGVYALKHPNKVPTRIAIVLIAIAFGGGFVFFLQHLVFHGFDMSPYYYCIAGTAYLLLEARTELYDPNRVLVMTNEQYNDRGIMVLDKNRRFLGCNEYQLKQAPNLGKLKLDCPIPPQVPFSEMYTAAYDELDTLEPTATIERSLEFGPKTFKVTIRNLLDENKRKVGYVVENEDYTNIKQYIDKINAINAELAEANEKAKVASKAKTVFLASMTHELRTPINAILGFNSMVLKSTKEDNVKELANNVQIAGNNLLALVNDILDVSKLETGKMNVVPEEYELASLLSESYNMVSYRRLDKGLDFIVDSDENIPCRLFGDEVRIRQILVNLLTNAFKYTDKGFVKLSVFYEKNGDDVINLILSVKDSGKGISEDGQKELFSDFTRVDEKNNNHIEGTGLGLSIVKQLTELMDGKIEVTSQLGKGSEFKVIIPQKIISDKPMGSFENVLAKQNEATVDESNALINVEGKILVVDDNMVNRRVLQMLLKSTKLKIDQADSADAAVEATKNKKYDIIFMDHVMPDKDGIEAFKEIKNDKDNINSSTPCVMLTANESQEHIDLYSKEGFYGYLAKPVDINLLNKMILQLIK